MVACNVGDLHIILYHVTDTEIIGRDAEVADHYIVWPHRFRKERTGQVGHFTIRGWAVGKNRRFCVCEWYKANFDDMIKEVFNWKCSRT